jgi:hypothetical protein
LYRELKKFFRTTVIEKFKCYMEIYRYSEHLGLIKSLVQWFETKSLLIILFYFPLKNISLIWRHHHCRWRAAKFRPMLGSKGLWVGRDLYRATPAVTRGLGFSGLIRRTAPFSRLLRHTRGCGGCILTWILTGQKGCWNACAMYMWKIFRYWQNERCGSCVSC